MRKAFINWSSGKDAAYALYLVQQQREYSVEQLVTTINSNNDRVSMHDIPKELLLQQSESLKIPLHIISLDGSVSMESYNRRMAEETANLTAEGFTHSVFGDIFLEDLKEYRKQQLQKVDLEPVFPLWRMNTKKLMKGFLAAGFKAITVSVNSRLLDRSFCGRQIDEQFLKDLPPEVDPAGENGEFHSFVYDGPIFSRPLSFQKGKIEERSFASASKKEGNFSENNSESWDTEFYYCDLLPV